MISFKQFVTEKGPGLWANIHKKRKEGRPMRKKGEKQRQKESKLNNKN